MSGTPSPGRLSAADLDGLLRRPLLARLATVGADGYPSIVPVWIDWDGVAAWIVARARAAFVEDIERDSRVCLSVVDDDDPDRRAQLFGQAEFVGPPAPLAGRTLEIARRMAERYEGAEGLAYLDRSAHLARRLIRLQPMRVISWGSGAWHDRYIDPTSPSTDATPPVRRTT